MEIIPCVSVRGGAAARRAVAAMGWVPAASSTRAIAAERPDVIVVDDPSARDAAVWVRSARRAGVPVATIHDLGLGRVASDLAVDGSVLEGRAPMRGEPIGPAHMILDPRILQMRRRRIHPPAWRVLIALGGGAHIYPLAARIARAIAARVPAVRIRAAAGFASPRTRPSLPNGQWVTAPDGLARELSLATVAIVGGGVTLYEACALGVPAVALAVTAAQSRTIDGIARAGAARDAGRPPIDGRTIDRVADEAAALLRDARARRRMSAHGRQLVDGAGAFRVAARVLALSASRKGEAADAA
jgi:hypothetical protein